MQEQPDDVESVEIAREQAHVDKVNARVEILLRNADAITQEGLARGRSGSFGGLVERDAFVHVAARRKHLLNREHEGLVFGRLDFDDRTVHHVGRIGVLDEGFEPLVLDWRAPAAAPFYRATAAERLDVVRRRVIRCVREKVVSVEDDLLDPDASLEGMNVIGDGALIASLSRARTGQMRDIVATIQAHQDEAIRAPGDGVTIISGGPGTGKTVVALHRAAYLLYRDRRKFESSGVLVVGPSRTFMRYIERVLPSLGEDSASLRSVGELVDGYAAARIDSPELSRIKGSARIAPVVSRAARFADPSTAESLRLFYRGEVLQVTQSELRSIRRSVLRGNRKYNRSLRAAKDALSELLYRRLPAQLAADRTIAEFREDLAERDEYDAFFAAWWPMRRPHDVLRALGDAKYLQTCSSGVLRRDEIEALATDWSAHTAVDGSMALSAQDVALLDEIRDVLGEIPPPPKQRTELEIAELQELTTAADREYAAAGPRVRPENYSGYGHVILDEAQDLSPMQWRMLGRRGRNASWTVVGDIAQTSWHDPAEARAAMDEALARPPRREFLLDTNYRSPAEVFTLAADVVRTVMPDADIPAAVRSTGHPPEHVLSRDLRLPVLDAVRRMLDDVEGTVAVIAPASRVEEVTSWLSGGERALPGRDRVVVIDELSVKGLEYDGVVVVEPDQIAGDDDRGVRLLYVVLTRATQRLVTVGTSQRWLPANVAAAS
ncbi:ATP-binding domain-containing protein [Blastococcus sp. Marseille-P5729]|uniref:HelD family protein n=1 Tax=Blastococcus sp. Marseille-P5729 TaxID=2086582 RepID=UPI000D10C0C3|nr:ATP-binding domain-containing protein [Blastococcus sp. Marseille-P5729]